MTTAPVTARLGVYKLLSVLLQYPDREIRGLFEQATAAATRIEHPAARRSIERFLSEVRDMPSADLESAYVETFDFDRGTALHLTYHVWGDQRARGAQLARLVRHYADAGRPLDTSELPDYLPVMLEFAEIADAPAGRQVLEEFREPIELIRGRLSECDSPYAHLFDALCADLPDMSDEQRDELRRLAESEPPEELVGLAAYGEEVMRAHIPGQGCG